MEFSRLLFKMLVTFFMYPIFKIKKIHLKFTQGDLLTNRLLNSMKFCIGKK